MSPLAAIACACIGVLVVESALRLYAPTYARPSTLIESTADIVECVARRLGDVYARATDLLRWLREVFGHDVRALVDATLRLLAAPTAAVRAYVAYYTSTVTETPLLAAIVTSAALIGCAAVYLGFTYASSMHAMHEMLIDTMLYVFSSMPFHTAHTNNVLNAYIGVAMFTLLLCTGIMSPVILPPNDYQNLGVPSDERMATRKRT